MLKRIYVNNFRCLVNFELTFDNINLILGYNGSGKSTLFDVINKLQKFIIGEQKIEDIFHYEDLNKWQESLIQSFEIEFTINERIYKYFLTIEYSSTTKIPVIQKESLTINTGFSFEFDLNDEQNKSYGQLKINNSTSDREALFPEISSSRSMFIFIPIDDKKLKTSWFKQGLSNFFIIRINPLNIYAESRTEDESPNKDLSNFSAWYSHLSQSEQGKIIKLTLELQKVLIGFDSFQNTKIGEARLLSAVFTKPSKATYKFNELSEGQKVLIALYTLLYCTPDQDCTLMIDEPENFLALPEIQPWLSKLIDRCQENDVQAILISHHPSLINTLATDYGYWFERKDNQAVRVQKIVDEGEEGGLSIAKLIEMKWIYDQ